MMAAFFRRFRRRVLVAAVLVRHPGGLAREQRALDADAPPIRHRQLLA
ncbi:hypothetical protein [Herbiconiux daphne]|uniref:Uncharacterized protein n=1 Tax=Herbiconiux daphne TaxID=2970914 RepID=A0ABT2H143_9MICO|nr:hypothetical protein [Herbiconiux daphne]MCS5733653.1 hypothetical protein [Herbiconiux daphne]